MTDSVQTIEAAAPTLQTNHGSTPPLPPPVFMEQFSKQTQHHFLEPRRWQHRQGLRSGTTEPN